MTNSAPTSAARRMGCVLSPPRTTSRLRIAAHFHPIPAVKIISRPAAVDPAERDTPFLSSFRNNRIALASACMRNCLNTPFQKRIASYGVTWLAVWKRRQRPSAGHTSKGAQKDKRKRFHTLFPWKNFTYCSFYPKAKRHARTKRTGTATAASSCIRAERRTWGTRREYA